MTSLKGFGILEARLPLPLFRTLAASISWILTYYTGPLRTVKGQDQDKMAAGGIVEKSANFRDYLIPLDHPRLHPSERNARDHAKGVLRNREIFLTPVAEGWLNNYNSQYRGFTTDGKVVPDLWHASPKANGPTKEMVDAAEQVLSTASAAERKAFSYAVDAREWRSWSNPEVMPSGFC